MSNQSIILDKKLRKYLIDFSVKETPELKKLRKETSSLKDFQMQICPEQGTLMAFLVKSISAKRTLDIGVFTGYSSLVVAQNIPSDGHVVAMDISTEWTNIAKKYWRLAGVDGKIKLCIDNATKTLDKLLKNGEGSSYDFSFIDADKINYQKYFDRSLRLIRKGGIIAIDNVLWDGKVIDKNDNDPATIAIRDFNKSLFKDPRVSISMIPIGDGLTLAYKL